MAQPAAVLSILLTANTKGASTGILRVNQQLDATQGKAHKAGAALAGFAKIASVGVAVGIGYAVKKAADFESQLDSLGSVAGATGRQMETLRKQAMKAGADTKFSALEAAKAQTELAKGGLKVKQILDGGLNASLALAAAGEMDLADAAAATANSMNLFGLKGKQAMKVADMLAKAANSTTADVSDFAMALSQGGAVAKSAGLSFKDTVLALEALAKSGIKNSDAGTSLKTAMIQLIKPTAKQKELADKLNVSFIDQKGHFKDLGDVSKMLHGRMGEMTKVQRTAAFATLAGTDGVRTLTALYDAGKPRLDKWAKGLDKTGTAAKVAAEKQDNFKGKLENLKGSIETAAIAIGTKMLPALTDAAKKITDIINDPKLTSGEKFEKLAKMLGDAFSKAIPIIADKAAQAAPIAANAFVKGFLAAGVWGRLAIAGFLLSKMGGVPAFMKVGQQAGGAVGSGMGAGIAKSGLKGKMVGLMGSWGPALGVALGVALAPEVIKGLKEINPSKEKRGEDKFKAIRDGAKSFDQLSTAVHKTNAEFDANETASAGLNPALKRVQGSVQQVQDAFNKTAEPVRRVERLIENMATGSSSSMAGLRAKVKLNTERIKKALGDDTKAGKDALTKNFLAAAQNARRSMREAGKVTKEGTALIEHYMVLALQGMGFSKKAAVNLRRRGSGSTQTPGPSGELTPHARGGHITGGKPTGDSIPSLLERGEYVVNRRAVKKVGKQALDRLNFGAAPRFQSGGMAGMVGAANKLDAAGFPYVWGGGHQGSPAPYGPMDCSGAVSFVLQHGGVKIPTMVSGALASAGMPGPGPVTVFANAVHTFMKIGNRFFGTSGTNPGGGAGWFPKPDAGYLSGFTQRHFDAAGGIGNVPRVLVGGPDSLLKSIVQGALDTTRGGANQSLSSMMGSPVGAGDVGDFSGKWTDVMASIAKSRGWSLAAWQRLVQKESGGNPNARNPSSGAFGLGQFLGATGQAYAKYGALSSNPVDQIRAMAQYISDRYGNPSAALAFHNANNWYAAGGLAGGLKNTLKKVRNVKSQKVRQVAVRKLLQRVRDVGLPKGIAGDLKTFSDTAATAGEMADRAGLLAGDDGAVGSAGGKTQIQWLEEQLEALFKWRNAIIRAEEIVVARRTMIHTLIETSRKRLGKINDQLHTLGRHPKKNKAAIAVLNREKTAIHDKILPALTGKREGLNTLHGDLLENLDTVQGIGSPTGVLKSLPALGVLGGQILGAQVALRDLNAPKTSVTDSGSSESDSVVAQLLREANLRTAVSQAQYKVFRDFPQFATGGIVPGPIGQAVPAIVHGGEGVFRRDQMAAMGAGQINVTVVVQDGAVDKNKIKVLATEAMRETSRGAARGLPGRGGH